MALSGLDIPNQRVRVDMACNDPDNGIFAGTVEQIQIGDGLMEFEARRRAPRFVEVARGFRMSGKTFPCHGSVEYIGNWCWNGYWLDIGLCVHFLEWLHKRNLFDLSTGESRLFNRWRQRDAFTHSDLAFLRDQLGEPSNFGG